MYFRILSEFHACQERVKYIVCDTIKGGYEKMISSSPVLVALRKVHLLTWVIRKRVDSYTTELDQGGEEKFERIVIYAPLLTLMLRTYLGGERVWNLLGHKIDPQFRRLVTAPTSNSSAKKSRTGLFVLGAAVAMGVGAGAYFFQDRIRAAFPSQQ